MSTIDQSKAFTQPNLAIADTNAAYADLILSNHVTIPEYRQVVQTELERRQSEAFLALVTDGNESYDLRLAEYETRRRALSIEMGRTSMTLSSIDDVFSQRLHDQRDLILAALPDLADKLSSIKVSDREKEILQVRLTALESELEKLDERYVDLTEAWAIPGLIDPEVIQGLCDTREDDENHAEIYIDTFPDEGTIRDDQVSGIVSSMRERRGDIERDASSMTALVLAEASMHAMTLAQIGEAIYNDTVTNKANRVSALISNEIRNKNSIIRDVLETEGLVLQKGMRQRVDFETGKNIGNRTPVFRAIPSEMADTQEVLGSSVFRNEVISWEKPIMTTKTRDVLNNRLVSSIIEDLQEDQRKDNDLDTREKNPMPDSLKKLLETANAFLDKVEFVPEMADIDIEQLRMHVESATFGSPVNIERAYRAHIISKSERDAKIVGSPQQVVAMAILNPNRVMFADKRKTKQALERILELIVERAHSTQEV